MQTGCGSDMEGGACGGACKNEGGSADRTRRAGSRTKGDNAYAAAQVGDGVRQLSV